jgi:iduronate 2-sulfatase
MINPADKGKEAAFSQFPTPALREWASLPLDTIMRKKFHELSASKELAIQKEFGDLWDRELFEYYLTGYAMRTERYRFIRWVDVRQPEKALARELYDHSNDPHETVNLANMPEHAKLIKKLEQKMKTAGVSY